MNHTLQEQQVLDMLQIPDFRHLSKDKVIEFASMLPHMDPEIARKALEQFPNFASTTLSVMDDYKVTLEESLRGNKESVKMCYDTYMEVMDALKLMLDKDDLTVDERFQVMTRMKEIADEMNQKDTENKTFLLKAISIAGTAALGITVVLASTLGVNLTGSKK